MKFLFVLLLSFGFSFQTQADRGKTRAQLVEACKPDMEKHCKGLVLGEGLLKCMESHEKELTPACQSARGEAKKTFREKREAVRTACEKDFETHCKGVFGPRNRIDCLRKNYDQLGAGCKASFPNRN